MILEFSIGTEDQKTAINTRHVVQVNRVDKAKCQIWLVGGRGVLAYESYDDVVSALASADKAEALGKTGPVEPGRWVS